MIYLMHEIHYDLDIDWYNVYPYKNKDTALEHISNEVNEPLEDIKEYKVSKADKQKYMEMHEENVNAFAEKFGEKEILIGDASKEEERRDDR